MCVVKCVRSRAYIRTIHFEYKAVTTKSYYSEDLFSYRPQIDNTVYPSPIHTLDSINGEELFMVLVPIIAAK